MKPSVLILGLTGSIGRPFAAACAKNGWRIKALHRDPQSVKATLAQLGEIKWIKGDAMDKNAVVSAAKGVDVIFHGLNTPGYKKWRQLTIPMLENSISAARASKARLVFPGNIYNFGPDAWPLVSEDSPQNPISIKGNIRVEMEQMLARAAKKGARVLIVRAGDFFGPDAPDSWYVKGIIKPGKKLKSVQYPGIHTVGHSWAYLPDFAETFIQILQKEDHLTDFDVYHFGGHYFPQGVDTAKQTAQIAGIPNAPIKAMPWVILKLASPFVALFRELLEMRYLWNKDIRLDNSKLTALLGKEPHTPTEKALSVTLKSYHCI